MLRLGLLALALLTLSAGAARSEDTAGLKAEIARLRTRVEALRARENPDKRKRMGPTGNDYPERLISMKKKGTVRIGGTVEVDVNFLRRDDSTSKSDWVDSTFFSASTAALDFEIRASRDVRLIIGLNLGDAWDEATAQDDLLGEVYFLWRHVHGSNWSLIFGKKAADYGMDYSLGMTPSFHSGSAFWLSGLEGSTSDGGSGGNLHDIIGTNTLASGPVEVFQVEAIYSHQELATFYFTLFQSNDSMGGAGRLTRGMHEDRADDHLGFQSLAFKAEFTPLEGLSLQASALKQHTDSFGDKAEFGNSAVADEYAVSFGFDYVCANWPLEIFGEYQHGWNWNYDDNIDTDTVQLGLIWNTTDALDLGLMGEWAHIDNGFGTLANVSVEFEEEDYWQLAVNATYNFTNGVYMMVEYAHLWWDGDIDGGGDADRAADMIGFRTGWQF